LLASQQRQTDIVNLSKYSQRPGTEAAEMIQIEKAEVKRRSKIIADLADQISLENNQKWIGWRGEVLFDEKTDNGIKGRNFAYKPIFVDEPIELGQRHVVEIINASNHGLAGAIRS